MHNTRTPRFLQAALEVLGRHNLAWTLTWSVIILDAVWLLLTEWSLPWRGVVVAAIAGAAFLAPLAIGRYRRDLRLYTTLRAAALLIMFQAAGATLSYLVVGTNAALVDATLAAWDRALGFDWLALQAWIANHPNIQTMLSFAYQSGMMQLIFVLLFLGFCARAEQLDQFMRLFIVATLLTIVASGFFPAAGTWQHYALAEKLDLLSLSHFDLLRDGRMRDIPLGQHMQGLISMPSLHAATAVLLMHAMRGTRLVPAFIALNLAMLVSTPIDGGHYLVDVLAGIALAVGLIALEPRRSARPRSAVYPVTNEGLRAAHQ
ncbi:MAG: phosphatase PAP2 family protein [Burkholderiales bacterium]|nr:phosphatase PAP2 family protein [Burkholderiales bacterium]